MKTILALLTVLIFWSPAYCIKDKSLYVGISYFGHGISKYASGADNKAGFLGPVTYPFFLQYYVSVSQSFLFGPSLYYTILPYNSPDGVVKDTFIMLNFPFKYTTGGKDDGFNFTVGPTIIQYDVKGDGGAKTVRNGGGTATFQAPGSATARTIALDLGGGYSWDAFHMGLDIFTEGFLNGYRRTMSLMLSFSYGISR